MDISLHPSIKGFFIALTHGVLRLLKGSTQACMFKRYSIRLRGKTRHMTALSGLLILQYCPTYCCILSVELYSAYA